MGPSNLVYTFSDVLCDICVHKSSVCRNNLLAGFGFGVGGCGLGV